MPTSWSKDSPSQLDTAQGNNCPANAEVYWPANLREAISTQLFRIGEKMPRLSIRWLQQQRVRREGVGLPLQEISGSLSNNPCGMAARAVLSKEHSPQDTVRGHTGFESTGP